MLMIWYLLFLCLWTSIYLAIIHVLLHMQLHFIYRGIKNTHLIDVRDAGVNFMQHLKAVSTVKLEI